MGPELSVVIPAYNEEQRLRRHVPGIVDYLKSRNLRFEIIVVDDGSKDGTAAVARTLPVRLISYQPNQGKGGAVKVGMLAAEGRYVLFTDADQSTPIQEVEKLLVKVREEGYDVAIGSRAVAGARIEEAQAWYRVWASRIIRWARTLLLLRGIKDTQCGFKLMTREAAQTIFPRVTSRMAIFDVEMLVVAARAGYRIAEVPVRWIHDPDTRIPYNLRRAVAIWLELFRIKWAQRVIWPVKART